MCFFYHPYCPGLNYKAVWRCISDQIIFDFKSSLCLWLSGQGSMQKLITMMFLSLSIRERASPVAAPVGGGLAGQ